MIAHYAADYVPPSQRIHLIFPEGDAQSISAHRVHNSDAFVAPFDAASWPLAALDSVIGYSRTLYFKDWPEGFQGFARHVAYALINHGNPDTFVEQQGSKAVDWLSTGSIGNTLDRLRAQIHWLTTDWSRCHPATPVNCPGDMDSQHLDDLKAWVEQRYPNKRQCGATLAEIVRIWHLNPWLPEDCQWPEPVWRHHQWQPNRPREENKTLPIAESTFAPLLEWATAFVTSFAPDILAAHRHYVTTTRTDGPMTATECLKWYASTGTPLPPSPNPKNTGIGWRVLAYRHATPARNFTRAYRRKLKESLIVGQEMSLTALDVPVTGKFHGRSWIPFISVYDMPSVGPGWDASGDASMFNHLRTACLIVVAALTGMRPDEVLNLQPGCAREPVLRPGGSRLQLIDGHVFKGPGRVKDGSPREPRPAVWATIPVAAAAIHTVEQLNEALGCGDGPLFSAGGSRCVTPQTAMRWIESFIEFVNTRLSPHTATPRAFTVLPDPEGNIVLQRFRRTLAWFVRHRPNGDITTAIQYQHVGTVMGEGYAGTKTSGMPDLLLEEDWNHRVSTIHHLDALHSAGQGISGPGADRAIKATRRIPRLLLPADERRLRKDPSLMVYDNPAAVALCVFVEEKALCRKLRDTAKDTRPDLLGCVEGCPNCARTDDHLRRLSRNASALQAQAEFVPLPMAQSMLAEADRLEQVVTDFSATRIISEERTPGPPPNYETVSDS